jgi:hypothetical protein
MTGRGTAAQRAAATRKTGNIRRWGHWRLPRKKAWFQLPESTVCYWAGNVLEANTIVLSGVAPVSANYFLQLIFNALH